MKTWNFKTESNPPDISKKLESKFGLGNGFVFSVNDDRKKSITFKIRKRILYGWYWAYQNWTIINGKLLKTDTEEGTNVEISFNQHFLIRIIMFTHIILGLGLLIAIISGQSDNNLLYIFGGIILVIGVFLWVALQRKFQKDTQQYKILISEILES